MFSFFDDGGYGNVPSIGNIDGGTVYGDEGGGGIDWNNILNQAFGIGSQAIGAFGHNPTQQIGSDGVYGIGQGYSPAAIAQQTAAQQQAAAQQAALLNAQRAAAAGQAGVGGVGSTVGSGVDGIVNWLAANPFVTFGGIAALFLLFREPPRGRR